MPQRNHHQEPASSKGKSGEEHRGGATTSRSRENTGGEKSGQHNPAASQKADDMAASVGSGMESLAGTLRGRIPTEGMMGQVAGAAADTLERTGRYLREEGVSGLTEDLSELIRRHPLPAVLVTLGLGFLLAQALGGR
jgi:hypothetical protein